MEIRRLGRDGPEVSAIGFGCITISPGIIITSLANDELGGPRGRRDRERVDQREDLGGVIDDGMHQR